MLPAAIAGAKGSGCLLASLPVRTAAAPYNAPIKTEKKKAAASIFTPSTKPITANNLISPPATCQNVFLRRQINTLSQALLRDT